MQLPSIDAPAEPTRCDYCGELIQIVDPPFCGACADREEEQRKEEEQRSRHRCPDCGVQRELTNYCGACADRLEMERRREHSNEYRRLAQQRVDDEMEQHNAELKRARIALELEQVRKRTRAYQESKSIEDLTPAEIAEERSIQRGEEEMQEAPFRGRE